MASSSHIPLSWKRKPDRASFTPPRERWRSGAVCWRLPRHKRHATRSQNCRSVRRRCRRTTSMVHRFYHFSFVIVWLSIGSLVCARSSQSSRPSTIIVIDAGHGGFDRGGILGQRIAEKTITLDVAQRLKAVLAANGYRVVMTRDSDVFVPLSTRVAIANSYRDAIFICVHFNAARHHH